MTDTIKNPPAFPCKALEYAPGKVGNEVATYYEAEGMTLRDYFAAAALTGIVSRDTTFEEQELNLALKTDNDWIAGTCYHLADAMLRARGQS